YDMSDFNALVGAIAHGFISPDHLPAVSFLKAPGFQDGHAGYSDPLDEQQFIVNEINALQHTPDWSSTAIVIAYDDSDGWYDHVFSGIHNTSKSVQDFLTGTGQCGDTTANPPLAGLLGRCGYGPRLPLLVISPWAKRNFVAHNITDQSSMIRFIEDNFGLPRISGSFDAIAGSLNSMFNFNQGGDHDRTLFLDPITGQPVRAGHRAGLRRLTQHWAGRGCGGPRVPPAASVMNKWLSLALGRLERERDRVDAPPLVGGHRVALALEDVTEVRAAGRAPDLGAQLPERAVLEQHHGVIAGGLVEAGPAAVGLELRVRAEQLSPAGAAAVD